MNPTKKSIDPQPAHQAKEDFRWFASLNQGIPEERFVEATVEIDLNDVIIDIVEDVTETENDITVVPLQPNRQTKVDVLPPAILPQPAHRIKTPLPAGALTDMPFHELNIILREMRTILAERKVMSEMEIDTIEWQLRERIARLSAVRR